MSRTSAMLTGLALATGVARDAADGVPIVKQVLGVASRIAGLAEQIDKNREDLHALADRAKRMERTIIAVVGDREPGAHLLCRLEDMNDVLRAVEKHFNKHVKQCAIRKTFGYIFTVRKEVDRLRGEFDDRLRELEVAATLDTNISAKRDAKFNGEFRNIRHCEIELLRQISPPDQSGRGYTINCHLATCDGSSQVVVVRQIVVCGRDEVVRPRIQTHNAILERMSLVQNRHPNIAYLYGRNTGPKDDRFIVLKAGDIRSADDLIGEGGVAISVMNRIISKLVDACCHLHKYGAAWSCVGLETPHLCLDKNYEPKIGVDDRLFTMDGTPGGRAFFTKVSIAVIIGVYCTPVITQETRFPSVQFNSTKWSIELFGALVEAGYRRYYHETVFRRDEIPSLILLSQESQTYLRHCDRTCEHVWPFWGSTLLDLAIGRRKRDGSFVFAAYVPPRFGMGARLWVYCTDYASDTVYHSTTLFKIPDPAVEEVTQRLGIPASEDTEAFHMKRFTGSGATSMECTRWQPTEYSLDCLHCRPYEIS